MRRADIDSNLNPGKFIYALGYFCSVISRHCALLKQIFEYPLGLRHNDSSLSKFRVGLID